MVMTSAMLPRDTLELHSPPPGHPLEQNSPPNSFFFFDFSLTQIGLSLRTPV